MKKILYEHKIPDVTFEVNGSHYISYIQDTEGIDIGCSSLLDINDEVELIYTKDNPFPSIWWACEYDIKEDKRPQYN